MNRTLLSLAILKTNWDTYQKDYIENFIPFVAALISQKKYSVLDNQQLSDDFKTEFGLIIPIHPIITILNRAVKRGLVKKQHSRLIPVIEKAKELDFGKRSIDQQRILEKVIVELKAFALSEFNQIIEDKDVEAAFISYLRDHDLEILFAAEHGSPLPDAKNPQKVSYIIAKFITECFKKEPLLFKFILDITVGHALAATILYREFNNFSGKLNSVTFYFDTRFFIRLLGLEERHMQESTEELLKILSEEKAKLSVFELTVQEVNGVLDDCIDKLQRGNIDITTASKALRYLVRHNKTVSDVEDLLLRIPALMDEFQIIVEPLPDYQSLTKFQIDENSFYNQIIEIYSSLDPSFDKIAKERTVRRDVDILSGIYRLRKGIQPQTIKEARAFFVSPNTALAYASKRFESKVNGLKFSMPTCITDVFLGTLIWLQSPAKVQEISQMKLISDCYAALQPTELLIKKFMDAVEALKNQGRITTDQYYLLRTHRAAINLLEQKTLGDPGLFDDKATEEILDDIIVNIKAEEKKLFDEEKELHRITLKQLEEEKIKRMTVEKSVVRRATQIATIISTGLTGILFILLTSSLIYRFFPDFVPSLVPYKNWLLLVAFISAILAFFVQLRIFSFRDKLKTWFEKQITNFFRSGSIK